MAARITLKDRFMFQRMMSYWTGAAQSAGTTELSALRNERQKARQLRGVIDKLLFTAEDRLALPRVGSANFPKPPGTRWSWRPPLWRGPIAPKGAVGLGNAATIGSGLKVFHDCSVSTLTCRQLRNNREEDLAPFGLQMDVLDFDGSFLSVSLDLPQDAAEGLRKRDILRVQVLISVERPAPVFARLNVKCGPNTSQMVEELPLAARDVAVDFDLAYSDIVENRIDAMWLDLIFDDPAMNQIVISDLTFCRYPRAEV